MPLLQTTMALPVGHSISVLSTLQLCIGKPFRQPLNLPDQGEFSQGLEILLNDSESDRKVFAMFKGEIRIQLSSSTDFSSLILKVDDLTVKRLSQPLHLIEPAPSLIIYQNIDLELTKQILIQLLKNAYTSAPSARALWHPILRIIRDNVTIKSLLDTATANGTFDTTAESLINTSVSQNLF